MVATVVYRPSRSYSTGLQKKAVGPQKEWQKGRKRVHDVKREESEYSDTWGRRDTGMLVVATARVETEFSQLAEKKAIRLTENSQEVLNTTTTETWPIIKDRTESIKCFEGHKQDNY